MSKKTPLNRREFLAAASLILGGAGVSALTRVDLLNKISKNLFGITPAYANTGGRVRYMIEIMGTAGVPLIPLGSPVEFTTANGNIYPNVPMNQVSDMAEVVTGSSRRLFMNNVAAGGRQSVATLLGPHARNIAVSQGYSALGFTHTGLFPQREGGMGASMTSPIIEFAHRTAASLPAQIISGVNWRRGMSGVVNQRNDMLDLIDVNSIEDFTKLFKTPRLRLNQSEILAVLDASKKLSQEQSNRLSRRIANIEQVKNNHAAAAVLFEQDLSARVNTQGMDPNFLIGTNPNIGGVDWGDMGAGLASVCRGFEHGLMNCATINFRTQDWHGFQAQSNTNEMATGARYLATILSATITFLKNTPDPADPSKRLFDSTLIVMSSEFTRGIPKIGPNEDNPDAGMTGFVMIGGMVRGGYYGAFDLTANRANPRGFDPSTGNPLASGMNNVTQIYNTVNEMLGNRLRATGTGSEVASCLVT